MRRLPPLSVSSAVRIGGRSPSKATSTTAPITWLMRPTRLLGDISFAGAPPVAEVAVALRARLRGFVSAAVAMSFFLAFDCMRLERLGARDDFDEFGGDRGLAGAVVLDRQAVDHVSGIPGRIVHRGHLGSVEAGLVLEEGAVDLNGNVARKEIGEDLFFVRLIFDSGGRGRLVSRYRMVRFFPDARSNRDD